MLDKQYIKKVLLLALKIEKKLQIISIKLKSTHLYLNRYVMTMMIHNF